MMCDYCSWIKEILAKIDAETQIKKRKKIMPRVDPIVVVHGGAGKIPRYARKFMLDEVKNAAVAAYRDLIRGCCSLDAVERAICHMENKKYFNCAYGGSLDANGEVVMDAAIMTNDLRVGCVGAVRNIAHPITLAKLVLQRTEHVLIVEEGAQKLALESNLPILSPDQLIVTIDSKASLHEEEDNEILNDTRKTRLLQDEEKQSDTKKCILGCVIERHEDEKSVSEVAIIKSDESLMIEPDIFQLGGVGAVAYDRKKRLASGTSTAGEAGKLYGSVSATGTAIGCGIYVDQSGSVSVSGCDKAIYKYAPAQQILQRLRCKTTSIDEAVTAVLQDFEEKMDVSSSKPDVGIILVTVEGIPFVSFKCAHFPWAYCDKGYVYYGCARNERFSEKLDVLERPLDCMCEDSN